MRSDGDDGDSSSMDWVACNLQCLCHSCQLHCQSCRAGYVGNKSRSISRRCKPTRWDVWRE